MTKSCANTQMALSNPCTATSYPSVSRWRSGKRSAKTSTCEVISHTCLHTLERCSRQGPCVWFSPTLHHSLMEEPGCIYSEVWKTYSCRLLSFFQFSINLIFSSDQYKKNPFQPTVKYSPLKNNKQSTCLAFSETTRSSRMVVSLTVRPV